MTFYGIEFKRASTGLWLFAMAVAGGLLALVSYIIFVVGPLWPVGRLMMLRNTETALAADGIKNPREQRVSSAVALALVVLIPCMVWAGVQGDLRWYAAAAGALVLYLWLTIAVFGDAMLNAALTTFFASGDNADSKQTTGMYVFAALAGTLVLVLVYLIIDKVLCLFFSSC